MAAAIRLIGLPRADQIVAAGLGIPPDGVQPVVVIVGGGMAEVIIGVGHLPIVEDEQVRRAVIPEDDGSPPEIGFGYAGEPVMRAVEVVGG